jgi:hypothetical protein
MGSHSVDSSTQKQASAGAQQNDAVLAANAQKNQQFADQTRQSLFGNYSGGKYTGGELSSYLDPSTMNRSGLAGSYLSNYNTASNDLAQGAKNSVGTTMTNLAERGMGKSPAGFAADQERKAYMDAAGQRGGLYSGLATQQHGEDVSNFWNANNMLNSNASQTANLSLQGNQAAAGNYASLYGTASQQVQNPWAVAGDTLAGMGKAASGFMPKP